MRCVTSRLADATPLTPCPRDHSFGGVIKQSHSETTSRATGFSEVSSPLVALTSLVRRSVSQSVSWSHLLTTSTSFDQATQFNSHLEHTLPGE